jgi:hypothetical protein
VEFEDLRTAEAVNLNGFHGHSPLTRSMDSMFCPAIVASK